MRQRRRVVNAEDIGGIAVIGLQNGYVGFELLQCVFDFFWPVDGQNAPRISNHKTTGD